MASYAYFFGYRTAFYFKADPPEGVYLVKHWIKRERCFPNIEWKVFSKGWVIKEFKLVRLVNKRFSMDTMMTWWLLNLQAITIKIYMHRELLCSILWKTVSNSRSILFMMLVKLLMVKHKIWLKHWLHLWGNFNTLDSTNLFSKIVLLLYSLDMMRKTPPCRSWIHSSKLRNNSQRK